MKTKHVLSWIVAVFWLPLIECAALDYRIFTNKDGVEIKAALVAVRGGKVTLKKDDGKTYAIPVDTLSDEDKDYVKRWMAKNVHVSLDFRFEKEKLGSSEEGKIEITEWAYNITVTNRGFNDLEDVTFKYALFKERNDRYAEDRNEVVDAALGAELPKDLARTKSLTFKTTPMKVGKENSKTFTGTVNGVNQYTMRKWNESLCGVTVEVYVKGKLVERKDFGKVVPVRLDAKADDKTKDDEAPERDSDETE